MFSDINHYGTVRVLCILNNVCIHRYLYNNKLYNYIETTIIIKYQLTYENYL